MNPTVVFSDRRLHRLLVAICKNGARAVQRLVCSKPSVAFLSAALVVAPTYAPAQQIVTDGRTATILSINGNVTDVATATQSGANAFNSFSRFGVDAGNVVNLHVPTSANNLINIVRDERTNVYGILNAIKEGRIGGNVYFANPHGFVVGAGGILNIGSLSVSTPTQAFVDGFFTSPGTPNEQAVQQLLAGTAPRSGSGLISIDGTVNAIEEIRLMAGSISVGGGVYAGARFLGETPRFDSVVNANGVDSATNVVVKEGRVVLVADNDVEISGTVAATGGAGVNGGEVVIRAGRDVALNAGANVAVRGNGENSSGGTIDIWADNNASFRSGATLDASGGLSGDGGFIELSAKEKVTVDGGRFAAAARNGRAGSILIDPNDIEIVQFNEFTDGANFSLIANDSITVNSNVVISTRNLNNVATDDHMIAASQGDSGNLFLKASHIVLENGAKLLAHGDNGHEGGDVTVEAFHLNALGADRTASASIKAENAIITGRNVTVSAVAETSAIRQLLEQAPNIPVSDAQKFIDDEADDLSDGPGGEYLAVKTKATAKVELYGVDVQGSGAVKVAAEAAARAGFKKEATADVIVGDFLDSNNVLVASSRIQGDTVEIASKSDTSLTFNVLGNALRLADQSWLPDPNSQGVETLNEQLFDFSSVPLVSLSESTARTVISGATTVSAADTVTVSSEAVSAAKPTFSSPFLFSAAWGESTVTAQTNVGGTTQLNGSNKVAVKATTDAEVNVTADVNSTNKPIDAVFVYLKNEAVTTATVGDDTTTTAGAVDVAASSKADISAGALAKNTGGSGFGIAVAVNKSSTTTTATLGGDVTATSGDVRVNATTTIEKNNTSAEAATLGNPTILTKIESFRDRFKGNVVGSILGATGKVDQAKADRLTHFMFPGIKEGKFNASGAVTYTDSNNVATASIAPRATVKAEGGIDVKSLIQDRPNASVGSKSTSTGTAIGGSAVIADFTNTSNAFIGANATVDAEGALVVDAQTLVPYPWQIDWSSPAAILNHLQDGILDLLLTSYAINSASGKDGVGLAAAVSVFGLENNSTAYIDEGAKINTVFDKDTMTLPQQSVTVHAKNDVNTVNAVGILSKKFLGTSGGKAAIGGSANIIDITGNASATIRGDAEVKSENGVEVKAESVNQLVAVTEAGGSSDKVGIEGALSMNTITNTTIAAIDDDANVDVGGNVNIEALSDVETISVAGGVVATKGPVGIGMSVSLNTLTSDTRAYLGNYDPLQTDTAPATGNVAIGGNLAIKATSDTELGSYSVAGALATTSSAQTDSPGNAQQTQDGAGSAGGSSNSGKGSFGIAVSGDASVNTIDSDTLAYIADGVTVSRVVDAEIAATNTLALNALSGAVTISTQQSGNSLAGSYAQNTLIGATAAYVNDAELTLTGNLDLDANVGGEINTLSASLAGAKGKVGVAGSVSINEIANRTETYLARSSIHDVQSLTLSALDNSSIKSIAGAIAFGGKAGVGLSFAWNKLDNDTLTYIEDSDVAADGAVNVSATTDNSIDTISAAIGASQGQMAGAGAVSINTITNNTNAYITGKKTAAGIDAAGTVGVNAVDDSSIFAVAGSFAANTSQAGVGVSFAWSEVDNTVSAGIRGGADVESTAGDVEVKADSGTEIEAIAAGGAVANKVGVAGSVSLVQAKNRVSAGIEGTSKVVADGNALVTADDDVRIFSLAGNVALGGKAAVGVANSTLITDNTVEATIAGTADVSAEGNQAADDVYTGKKSSGNRTTEQRKGVVVSATSHEEIQTIAAAGAGAGKAGVAGSATVTLLDETTNATIGNGAKVNQTNTGASADQDVLVRASDETELLGVAGALAFGGSAGVGAGADVGVITKNTQATIDSSAATPTVVNARKTIQVDARNVEDIQSISASLAAGGSAGVAGSASVYDITSNTIANIGESANVFSDGNVAVAAEDATELDLIAGNAAFGGSAGVGASAGVSIINKTTHATIDANANVTALGNAAAGVDVGNGIFGVSFVADSSDEGEVSAPNASPDGSDSQAIGQQRTASANKTNVKGVAVSAVSKNDVESISATGAIGGSAAVTLAGNVNVITTDTTAAIANGAQINQSNQNNAGAEQSVLVAAGNDHYHMGVAGSASGGGSAGIGVGADVLVASHTTKASIGDSADVRARRDVVVNAAVQQEILSISAGLGVSGSVGVAGSAAVISIDNTTEARTGTGSVVDADGNVSIAASDTTETDLVVGTVAIGIGAAGVGGSVGVTKISKDTIAAVGSNATVNARGNNTGTMTAYTGEDLTGTQAIKGLSVQATSSEDVFAISAAGAGGFYAGVAGAVTVETIDSNTTATIGANADINKGVSNGDAAQDVHVGARNAAELVVGTGALGIGIAGVAGGVDVATVKNDTSASIGDGAEVFARRDVDVNALSVTDLDSTVVSAGGGIVGVAGAVAVYSVGSGLDQASRDRLATSEDDEFANVNSYADDQAADGSVGSLLAGSSDSNIQSISGRAQAKRSAISVSGDLATGTPSGNSAFIGNAVVDAGRHVDVDARQQLNVDVLTGALAIGGVGLGVGVGVVNANSANQAFIAGGAQVSANDDVTVTARSGTNGNVDAYVGSGGVVAIDAGVAIYNDNTTTAAYIGNAAQITRADTVDIDAIDRRTINAHAFGASIGAAAAGASVATATIGGTVQASIGADVQIGQGVGQVNGVSVTADSESTAESDAEAAKAGLGLAAGGAASTAKADAVVTASIGNGADVTVQNAVDIDAIGKISADAAALGINVSLGASVGASVALAEASPHITASIGSNVSITADDLSVDAAQAVLGSGTQARATGASGGLLAGINATVATAENTGNVAASVGDNSTLTVSGTTHVGADNDSKQRSTAEGLSFGLLAIGANVSKADSNTQTQATLGDGVKLSGGALEVIASGQDDNLAYALAGSGGAISGLASAASTSNLSQTYARTGSGTSTRSIDVDTVLIDASHTAKFNSQVDSTNASLVGASGASASNTVNSRSEAHLGVGAYVLADTIVMRASNDSEKTWLTASAFPWLTGVPEWNVKSGSGGLLDLPAATSTTIIANNALVQVGADAYVEQTGDRNNPGAFALDAWNEVVARDKVKLDSGGAIAVPKGSSKILADVNNATVRVADGAEMTSVGDMNMGARSIADVYTQVAVDTYGLAGAPQGESVSRFQATNRVEIGDATLESLHDINLGAGRNTANQANDLAATARTDLWNNTAIPISTDPEADAVINTHSAISVGAGADIGAVRHVTLFADKGSADASGVGIGKDIYREALAAVASAVSNAFGGEDVSFETRAGSSIKNQSSDVTVDGDVKVGIHRKQELEIGIDGTATKRTDGISIASTGFKDVAADILTRIEALEDLIRQYSVDNANADASIAVAAYRSEIRFLERKLVELGFPRDPSGGGFSGVQRVTALQAAQESVTGMNGTVVVYNGQKTTLETTNSGLNGQIATHQATISNNNVTIAANNATIAGLDPDDDAAEITRLRNENTTLANQNNTLTNTTIPGLQAQEATNTTEIVRLTDLIDGLSVQIADIQTGIANGEFSTQLFGGPVAKFLTISDVVAQLGNIYVRGDTLHGTGTLDAPGDAEIKITNNGPNFLVLKDLTIPPDEGGKLFFNSIDVRDNAQINGINGPSAGAAFDIHTAESQVDGAGNPLPPAKPQILITSNYDPLDPLYIAQTPSGTPTLAPDIIMQGDVSNLRGLVKIDSAAGSIRLEQKVDGNGNLIPGETATIRAGEVDIQTRNGDFVQSYANAFFHTAGAPLFIEPGDPNLAFPGNIDEIERSPEQPGAGIVANGSVLIAARYLNINGNIQSGIPEWGVVVPSGATVTVAGNASASFAQAQTHYNNLSAVDKAKLGAEYYTVSGATVAGLTGNVQGNWEKVNVRYNAKENRLELGGVQVQGGYIELFGQIFNTNQNGGGKLNVLDGYGQIKVDNRTGLDMWVNTLDTGHGVKGEINITNITGLDSSGRPIITTTQYTRDPGDARTGWFYNPAAGQRYVMTVGYDTAREEYYRYSQSGWFDIGATYSSLALDQYRINSIVRSNDPLSQGEFLQVWPSPSGTNAHYFGRTQTETTSSKLSPGRSWKECNWWTLCANAKYYQEFSIATGTKSVITDSVRGDYPVAINFIGFDQGTVDVQSTGNVVLNASVNNRVGDTRIASTAGSVTQNGDLAIVGGTNVSLAAATGIGTANQSLQVNVGGELDAISTTGDVRVKQMVGDLNVDTVGGAGVANVVLEAERSLLTANANSYVQGQRVELIARNGGIGELGAVNDPLVVRTGYTANQSQWPNYGLAATARDSINISNVADAANAGVYSGNLLLISAESQAGDVRIQTAGTVIDNNPFAVIDERSVQELNDLWDSMRLRGTRAAEKADETVASFENGVTQQYQLYWITRQRQADSTAYDAGFQFQVSALERTQLAANGMNAAAITAFEASKTAEYHQLHARLYGGTASSVQGPVAATFDSAFHYVADGSERDAMVNGSSWSDSQLALSVGGGLLKDVTDTVTVIKQPNAKGRNVTLIAGQGIGSLDAPLQIDLSQGLNALTPEQKAALAAAERGDATVAGSIITITQPRPVNVEVGTGALVADAGAGRAFIGSEKDLRIDIVTAGADIRIKATGSLVNAASVGGAVNIVGDDLILESADGGIGSVADPNTGTVSTPLRTRLNIGASFIARAANDIWVEEAGDLSVDTVFSRKDVRLTAAGSIFDFDLGSDVNILSDDLTLVAQNGSIGELLNPLDVGVDADGRIRATAMGGVYLNGPAGSSFNIGEVRAGNVVGLGTDVNMLIDGVVDAPGQVALASGGHIEMTQNAAVTADTIGALVNAGTLTMDDGASLHVGLGTIRVVTDGTMRITGIETGNDGVNNMNGAASSIYLESLNGSIFDNGDTRLDIITDTAPAAKLVIRAAGQIGGNPLDVRLLNLESVSGGLTHINEQDSLHVDSTEAGGEMVLRAGVGGAGSIDADFIHADSVNLFAPDNINVATLHADSALNLGADRIDAAVTHTGTSGMLAANVGGPNGGAATFVDLDMTSPIGIAFDQLSVVDGTLRVPNTPLYVANAFVGDRLTVDNLLTFLLIDQRDMTPQWTTDVQLYAPTQPFAFNLAQRVVHTDATAIHFKDLTHSVISLVPGRDMDLRSNIERGLSIAKELSEEAVSEPIAGTAEVVRYDGSPVALPDCTTQPLPEECK